MQQCFCQCYHAAASWISSGGLPLVVRFFNARRIHLQRMVVQHHFLRVRDKRGKAQVIAQRLFSASSRKTFGAAAVADVFEPVRNNGGIISAVRFADPAPILRIMRILIQFLPLSCGLRYQRGDVSSLTTAYPAFHHRGNGAFHPKGGVDMHHDNHNLTPLRQKNATLTRNDHRIGGAACNGRR